TRIAFVSNSDPAGGNAAHRDQIFLIGRDGTGLVQATHHASGDISSLSVSDDGSRLAYVSTTNLAGGNADLNHEVFTVNSDGADGRQTTSSITRARLAA